MRISRLLNFVCIVFGGIVALYAQSGEQQNDYILIGGIFLLILGIYRLSRTIPSRFDKQDKETDIKTEAINED